MVISGLFHAKFIGLHYWIDEGIAIGIASHPFTTIPTVLQQDGSPPLYYLLLHVWMAVVGDSEVQTHLLSMVFAVAMVPVAYWSGRQLFGLRAAWTAALLATVNPFLHTFATETRMYSMMALLSLVVTTTYLIGFVQGRRGHLVGFAASLTAAMYTHNWGLFLGVGTALAVPVVWALTDDRRRVVRDAVLAFGAVGVAYLPWLPTVLSQRSSTGVPTFQPPTVLDFVAVSAIIDGVSTGALLFVVGGAAYVALLRGPRGPERSSAAVLLVIAASVVALGWTASQLTPAWHSRYLAAVVGPVLLIVVVGLVRAGRIGLLATGAVLLVWLAPIDTFLTEYEASDKSNARILAENMNPDLRPGDLVVSPEPAEVPVLSFYLRDGLRYSTSMGPVPDPGVTDHRGIVERIQVQTADLTLPPVLDALAPGARILFIRPHRPSDELPQVTTGSVLDEARVEADEDIPSYYDDVFLQTDITAQLLRSRPDLRPLRELSAPPEGSDWGPPLDALLFEKR